MAQKVRILYPGAIYHVMNRGDRREAIFGDDEDRHRLLQPQEPALAPRPPTPLENMTISLTPSWSWLVGGARCSRVDAFGRGGLIWASGFDPLPDGPPIHGQTAPSLVRTSDK